jgi:hypothetical protein
MRFIHDCIDVILSSRKETTGHKMVTFTVTHDSEGWRLRFLTRGYRPGSPYRLVGPPITFFEPFDLSSRGYPYSPLWTNGIGNTPWPELFIHLCRSGEFVPVQLERTCHTCCICPARAHQGRINGSATRATKSFHTKSPTFGSSQGSHREVCREGALRSPGSRPTLGMKEDSSYAWRSIA